MSTNIRKPITGPFSFFVPHLAFTSMKKEPCSRDKTGQMGNPHLDFLAGMAYTPSMAGIRLDSSS